MSTNIIDEDNELYIYQTIFNVYYGYYMREELGKEKRNSIRKSRPI